MEGIKMVSLLVKFYLNFYQRYGHDGIFCTCW